jgi:hypothetical protein
MGWGQAKVEDDGEYFGFKHSVKFYFTNFPEHVNYFDLRTAFEVCGILESVYVARKCNVHGSRFGFVRFSKVRDVTKLLNDINDICFGPFRIWAKVARFDKSFNKPKEMGLREMGGKADERDGGRQDKIIPTGHGEGEKIVRAAVRGEVVGEKQGWV